MTTTKKTTGTEVPAAAPTRQTRYFDYDTLNSPFPLRALNLPGDQEMGEDPTAYLERFGYVPMRGEDPEKAYYESTEAGSRFLIVVPAGDYRLCFHVKDDASLRSWRQQYERRTVRELLTMPYILPDTAAPAFQNHEIYHLDPRVVRHGVTNGHY